MFGLRSNKSRLAGCVSVVLVGLVVSACGSKPLYRAPVEDRTHSRTNADGTVKQPPGFENAGKAGYYTVKPKDTLTGIGLDSGQSSKDIARWNALENPDRIEVGQVLRVVPPLVSESNSVAVTRSVQSSSVMGTPVAPNQVKSNAAAAVASAAPALGASSATAPASAAAAPAAVPAAAPAGEDDPNWMWPAGGSVLAGFDEAKNKGLDIGGNAGDPVLAASDGRVVYAGEGLRGYGKLIILKHNNVYLTAYAHNRSLLVKEDATVKRGQKIAEMGDTDADRVKLHFEVRKQGKPVDPAKYMPSR
jgi:lipoprotein NlpD